MISAPSIFGRLPALGDCLRRNASPQQVEAWRTWFDTAAAVWSGKKSPVSRQAGQCSDGRPTFLVLSARELGFPGDGDGDGDVVDVVMPSRDRVGQRYPLVIWQSASGYWAEQLLESPATWLSSLVRVMCEHIHLRGSKTSLLWCMPFGRGIAPHWRSRHGIRFTQRIGSSYSGTLLNPRLTRPLVRQDWPLPRLQPGSVGCLWEVDRTSASQIASVGDLMCLMAEL